MARAREFKSPDGAVGPSGACIMISFALNNGCDIITRERIMEDSCHNDSTTLITTAPDRRTLLG